MDIRGIAPERILDIAFRLWNRLGVYPGPDDCWEDQGQIGKRGYGIISIRPEFSKLTTTHRLMWALTHGTIPEGKHVLHRCDNRKCCNPAHLFLGDQTINMRDMWAKDRGHVWGARLTREQVKEIRSKWGRTKRNAAHIAKEYGVDPKTVRNILKGASWKFLEDPEVEKQAHDVECQQCGHSWRVAGTRPKCSVCNTIKVTWLR